MAACGSGSALMSRRFSLGCHATRASRRIPALFRFFALSVFLVAILLILSPRAFAWDSHTHKLITRLAVEALPPRTARTNLRPQRAATRGILSRSRHGPQVAIRRGRGAPPLHRSRILRRLSVRGPRAELRHDGNQIRRAPDGDVRHAAMDNRSIRESGWVRVAQGRLRRDASLFRLYGSLRRRLDATAPYYEILRRLCGRRWSSSPLRGRRRSLRARNRASCPPAGPYRNDRIRMDAGHRRNS